MLEIIGGEGGSGRGTGISFGYSFEYTLDNAFSGSGVDIHWITGGDGGGITAASCHTNYGAGERQGSGITGTSWIGGSGSSVSRAVSTPSARSWTATGTGGLPGGLFILYAGGSINGTGKIDASGLNRCFWF